MFNNLKEVKERITRKKRISLQLPQFLSVSLSATNNLKQLETHTAIMKKNYKDGFEKNLEKMLENFSEDEILDIISKMKGGNIIDDYAKLMDEAYSYKAPSYSDLAKPMPDFMQKLYDARKIADTYSAYSEAKTRMQGMTQEERENETRNLLLNILAKAQRGEVDPINENQMILWAGMALVEAFNMKGLADTVLEVLAKQNFGFYRCYIDAFEEDCEYIISKVYCGQLDALSKLIHTKGFLPMAYSIILNAVVLMAEYDAANRLKYLAWISTTIAECAEKTLKTELLDRLILPAAEVHATELLPMLKTIYAKYIILSPVAPTYKDAENIIRNGYEEEYIQYDSLDEMLKGIKDLGEHEEDSTDFSNYYDDNNDDSPWYDDDDAYWDDLFISGQKNVDLFTLKVTLNDAPLEIMRQIEVPSNIRLDALAQILVIAMGWEGSHLNQFKADGKFYEETDEEADAFYKESGLKKLGQHEYSLKDMLNRKGKTIVWEYDFGDSWEHSITLESRRKKSAYDDYEVTLLKGKNACPPEDVGGVCGYAHFLQVINDPKSPDYLMMKNWASPNFSPKKFSKAKVQRAINDYLYGE